MLRLNGIQWGLPTQSETLHTLHPDEASVLEAVTKMKPSTLDFNPHHFASGGSSHFYVVAVVLKAASMFNFITLTPDKQYYRNNFREMDKIWITGRLISVFYSLLSILLIYLIGKAIFDPEIGLWSALILAIMPINVIDSQFLYFDTSTAFWLSLTLFLSLKIFRSGDTKWYIMAAVSAAMACGGKYYGAVAFFYPIYSHLIREKNFKFKYFVNKKFLITFVVFIGALILTNPYHLLAYREAIGALQRTSSLTYDRGLGTMETILGCNFCFFYPTLMTFALGIPLTALSLIGF
ncbi:MAG: glycosyltransferase family 39 protein, partial [Syntrophales bacterium LBB04]|nr:glycosyltransferase family 39 protein [Syntrophales bacterium LBB04]